LPDPPLQALFEIVAGPLGQTHTAGVRFGGLAASGRARTGGPFDANDIRLMAARCLLSLDTRSEA